MMTLSKWMTCLAVGFTVLVQATDAAGQNVTVRKPTNRAAVPADGIREADPLHDLVLDAIETSTRRYLTADVHTPWQIMHGILALRHDYQIKQGDEKIPALEWVSKNPVYKGEYWFQKTRYGGRAHPFSEAYAFEGHPNQFLAILTMSDLPMDYELQAGKDKITVADIVRNAQMEVKTGEEITWTLWALSHFLPPDARWTNKWGERWSIERMVKIQVDEPVERAACGGSHGMFALGYSRGRYLMHNRRLRGVWLEADQKINRYIRVARVNQNADGSFSAKFFQGREHSRDFATRLSYSGHTLEFIARSIPQHRLKESWFRRGITSVANDLIENRNAPAECGALYHALNGLQIYRERTMPQPQLTQTELKQESGEPLAGRENLPPKEVAVPAK